MVYGKCQAKLHPMIWPTIMESIRPGRWRWPSPDGCQRVGQRTSG